MSQNLNVGPTMQQIYFLIHQARELEAAIRYVQLAAGGASFAPRIILGITGTGKHSAERKPIEAGAFFKTLRALHPSDAQLRDIEAVEDRFGVAQP